MPKFTPPLLLSPAVLLRASLLPAVLLLALALRVWGLGWGLPSATHYFSYHPDESVVLGASSLPTMNVFAGRLLPHFYNYGSLQLYLVCFANTAAMLAGAIDIVPKDYAVWYPQWAKMYLVGRCLSVGMGVGTVFAVYGTGAHLWGRRAGLLAALTLAIMPLHAQQSHFLTVDVPATFWASVSLLWAARLATNDPRPLRAALWAGVFAGLAMATKYNLALAVLPLAAACVAARQWKPLALGLPLFVLVFLAACPGAILENALFLRDVRFEAVHLQNAADPTFRDTGSGFVYHIARNLDAGLGLPLLLLALASVGYAAFKRGRGDGLLAAFALPYYVLISLVAVRYARYTIPLLPILALWVGRMAADWSRSALPLRRGGGIFVGATVMVLTLLYALPIIGQMAVTDPRDQAEAWLQAHAPVPATIGFAAQPWFGTPPVSPYFSMFQPGGWRVMTSPELTERIVYSGKDWDEAALQAAKPAYVVLSEYDYRDGVRLHDASVETYLAALNEKGSAGGYRPAAAFRGFAPSITDRVEGRGGMLPRHGLPHDMLYPGPAITIYQRRP